MKKVIFLILLVVLFMGTSTAQTYKKEGNCFIATSTKESTYIPTSYTYKDKKGNIYTIYLHTITRGKNAGKQACYIRVMGKNGYTFRKIKIKPEELR